MGGKKTKSTSGPEAFALPYAQQGLQTAQTVQQQQQPRLNALSDLATSALSQNAGSYFGTNPYVENAQGAARAISNGFFLGNNPGQATYDRLSATTKPVVGGGGTRDPSMSLLSGMAQGGATDPSASILRGMATNTSALPGDASLTQLTQGGTNPADRFATATAQGKYLNAQPSADLYGRVMSQDYLTGNPYLQSVIDQTNANVRRDANRLFASRGMGAGIGSAFADVLSNNLAQNEGALRYQNYNDASNRQLQAAGQSDAAFSSERDRMGQANSLLASNYNAGQDRILSAAQALNAGANTAAGQRLSAAQALGSQFGAGQDRVLSAAQALGSQFNAGQDRALAASNATQDRALAAARAGDASREAQVAQMLQALGLTGQLTDAQYAGTNAGLGLINSAATVPFLGVDTTSGALANLINSTNKSTSKTSGGLGSSLLSAGAQLGSAAIMASDRRLKRDIVRVDTLPDGLGVYDFDYIDPAYGEGRHRGVMADEVAQRRPWALGPELPGGFQTVNYGAL